MRESRKNLKGILCVIGFFGVLAFSSMGGVRALSPAQDQEVPVESPELLLSRVSAGIESVYQGIQTLKLNFVQETRLGTLSRTVVKRGEMGFARPGKFFIRYATPPLKNYISDGKLLWVHFPEEQTVYETPLAKDSIDERAKLFLDGLGNLNGTFIVSALPDPQVDEALFSRDPQLVYLQLIPRQDSPFMEWLAIAVDRERFLVREMTVANKAENLSHYRFSELQMNVPFAESKFVLEKGLRSFIERQ